MSSNIINIVIDAVVRATLLELCGPQEPHNGLGWATGDQDIMRTAARNPIWVQGTLETLVRMFERSIQYINLGKTKEMTCTPGFIGYNLGKDKYMRKATSEGSTFLE